MQSELLCLATIIEKLLVRVLQTFRDCAAGKEIHSRLNVFSNSTITICVWKRNLIHLI